MNDIHALAIRGRLQAGGFPSHACSFMGDGFVFDGFDHDRRIIVTVDTELEPGVPWVHASISSRTRMPTYYDLKLMHRAVFQDGWAYQVFTPSSVHINIHEHCLHLFGREDGKPVLPDFTHGTGMI